MSNSQEIRPPAPSVTSPASQETEDKQLQGCAWAGGGLCVGAAILIFAVAFLVRSCKEESGSGEAGAKTSGSQADSGDTTGVRSGELGGGGQTDATPIEPTPIGLEFEELVKTSIPMSYNWKEEDTISFNDEEGGSGSTCVLAVSDGNLVLMTNFHCLGLHTLYQADSSDGSDAPEVMEYSMYLHFPGDNKVKVEQFGILDREVDLACLIVPLGDLKEGRDFVCAIPSESGYTVGDEVVAVGAPSGLAGTHTFGRISSIRYQPISSGEPVGMIQTDAAINHGNSGGPLFWKMRNRYIWIGVNSSRLEGQGEQNLGFAIMCGETGKSDATFYFANRAGVAEFFSEE